MQGAAARLRRLRARGSLPFGDVLSRSAALGRAALAIVRHGGNDAIFLEQRTLPTTWLGFERALGTRTSLVLQTSYAQSRYRDLFIVGLADRVFLFDAGLKRRVARLGTLFVAMTQDSPRGAMSDVAFHLGWQRGL